MDTSILITILVIAAVVIVALVIIAVVAGRQRKRKQQVARQQEASSLRNQGQQSDLSARALKADADRDRAEADRVRAEAEKARVEAEQLEQQADQRGQHAAAVREDAHDKLGTADRLDPDGRAPASGSGPIGNDRPARTDQRGDDRPDRGQPAPGGPAEGRPVGEPADLPGADRDRDEFGPRNG